MSPKYYDQKNNHKSHDMFNGFVLAAGFGTRMGDLTSDIPKPMLKMGGYPLLDHALFRLKLWNINSIVINTHYLSNSIENYVKSQEFPGVTISREEREILLSAGGIRTGAELYKYRRPIVTINPDIIYLPDEKDHPSASPFPSSEWDAILYLKDKDPRLNITGFNKNQHYKFEFPDNTEETFALEMPSEGGSYYYTGYAIINPDSLSHLAIHQPADIVPIWRKSAGKGRLFGRFFLGNIIDIGTRENYIVNSKTIPYTGSELLKWNEYVEGLEKD